MRTDPEGLSDLDARLVEAAKPIKILSHLTWPDRVRVEFLRGVGTGAPALPVVTPPRLDFRANIEALETLARACDPGHPVGRYLGRTARSYVGAARMLMSAGTSEFTRHSSTIYGRPEETIGASGIDNLAAAQRFLAAAEGLDATYYVPKEEYCITAARVAEVLRREVDAFFGEHRVDVAIDPDLPSKAAAGARRVRIRAATCYSEMDIAQLLQHEVFVHTATMLNGREQPHLKSLGLGAPRTTRTQEGLATFAELITSSIDLSRLKRIALRILAVRRALDGADFLETFRFFLDNGQNEEEAYHSAMRIFRGGDVRGRVVFTKDVVYLQGLVFTHTFLRKAIQEDRPTVIRRLFAGRLTLGDALDLERSFVSGFIAEPPREPRWSANRRALAAYLLYSVFANTVHLGQIRLDDFAETDDGR